MDEDRLEDKAEIVCELENYRDDIRRWSEMLIITEQVENLKQKNWLSLGCEDTLSQNLSAEISVKNADNQALQQTLITFISPQSDCCCKGEYLPNISLRFGVALWKTKIS